jgi:hypothetical protein
MKNKDAFYQWLYTLPFSEKFIDLYFPFVINIFISGFLLIGFSFLPKVSSAGIQNALSILLFLPTAFLLYYVQQGFYRYAFTKALKEFISFTRNNHTVTQLFATDLLSKILSDDPSILSFFYNNNKTLKQITVAIENKSGVIMNESMYANILTKSVSYQPTTVMAVWNTEKFPLANAMADYEYYFGILNSLYKDINSDQKGRIMIFPNKAEYESVISTPIWGDICNEHEKWGFNKIYFCFSEHYKKIRNSVYGPHSDINDFVFFKRNNKSEWIISRDDAQKVYLYKDSVEIETIKKFYVCLTAHCDRELQVIKFKD